MRPVPDRPVQALLAAGCRELEVVSNNCGYDGYGLGRLIVADRIARARCSCMMGGNSFERAFLAGRVEVELMPQGTLAERRRAWTEAPNLLGRRPEQHRAVARVALRQACRTPECPPGRPYVLETAITTEFALVHAAVGDRHGDLVYAAAARNFNPLCASAGLVTIAEVESLVEPGEIDPDRVDTPGVLVQRVVHVGPLASTSSGVRPVGGAWPPHPPAPATRDWRERSRGAGTYGGRGRRGRVLRQSRHD